MLRLNTAGILKLVTLFVLLATFSADIANAEVRFAGEPFKLATLELTKRGYETSFDSLVTLLGDPQEQIEIRQLGAMAIGESSEPSALDVLVSTLNNSDSKMRMAALEGIVLLKDQRAVPTLERVLTSLETSYMKQLALSGLTRIGTPRSRDAVIVAANDVGQDRSVRISIIEVLRKKPDSRSDALLTEFMADVDSVVRARAAIAISERNPNIAEPILIESVMDPDLPHYVWSDVVSQLEETSRRNFGRSGLESAEEKQRVRESIKNWSLSKNGQN